MIVENIEDLGFTVVESDGCTCATNIFPTLEALENHIKLMLIAVQSYKENKDGT